MASSAAPPLPDAASVLLASVESLPDIDSRDEAVRVFTSLRRLATTDEHAFLALCDHVGDGDGDDDGLSAILTGALACLENFPSYDDAVKMMALGAVSDAAFVPSNRRRMAKYDGLTEAVLDAVVAAINDDRDGGEEAASSDGGRGKLGTLEVALTEGCAALANLLAQPSACGGKLDSDRAVSAARVVSHSVAINHRSAPAVEAGCAALRQIMRAADDDPSSGAAVAAVALEEGFTAGVARCVESNPDAGPELHVQVAAAVNLLVRSASPPSFSFLEGEAAAASDAVSATCASLSRHGDERGVALPGLETLDRLLGSSKASAASDGGRSAAASSIARFDGVSAVAGAMVAHPSVARTQGTGCDILAKLGSHVRVGESSNNEEGAADAVEAILAAMTQTDYDDARLGGRARESACRALRILLSGVSPDPSFCSRVVRSGGVTSLLCAVRGNLNNATLVWEALEALLLLLRNSDECKVQMRGEGDAQTLLYEVSRRHPQRAGKVATVLMKAI